jgi:hypothetical protein
MGRVLKPGGVAGFQEPGPNHSKTAQSQFEMKQFTVIENDIIMRDIESWARAAGFTDLRLAVFTSDQFQTSIEGYDDFLAGGVTRTHLHEHMQPFVAERRIFFLSKGERSTADSRERRGLDARLAIRLDTDTAPGGTTITGHVTATNTGTTHWLASDAPQGPVLVGVHLLDADGKYVDRDYARIAFPRGSGGGVAAGETAAFDFELAVPESPGRYQLEFDLVAEHVAWFEMNAVPTVLLTLTVT